MVGLTFAMVLESGMPRTSAKWASLRMRLAMDCKDCRDVWWRQPPQAENIDPATHLNLPLTPEPEFENRAEYLDWIASQDADTLTESDIDAIEEEDIRSECGLDENGDTPLGYERHLDGDDALLIPSSTLRVSTPTEALDDMFVAIPNLERRQSHSYLEDGSDSEIYDQPGIPENWQ
jgi:hypothetical protein